MGQGQPRRLLTPRGRSGASLSGGRGFRTVFCLPPPQEGRPVCAGQVWLLAPFWRLPRPWFPQEEPARALLSCLPRGGWGWGWDIPGPGIVEAEDGACDGFLKLARRPVTGRPGSPSEPVLQAQEGAVSRPCEP